MIFFLVKNNIQAVVTEKNASNNPFENSFETNTCNFRTIKILMHQPIIWLFFRVPIYSSENKKFEFSTVFAFKSLRFPVEPLLEKPVVDEKFGFKNLNKWKLRSFCGFSALSSFWCKDQTWFHNPIVFYKCRVSNWGFSGKKSLFDL